LLMTLMILWCDTETIDVTHAILVVGVGKDLEVAKIEEELHSVRCWGRVRGTKPYSDGDGVLVLCECKEVIDPSLVPPEVRPNDGAIWKIITHAQQPTTSAPAEDFSVKLQRFLSSEGKTFADIQSMSSTDESVLRAMVDVVSRTTRSQTESHGYRRLRIFSGITPTPAGEETLEYWLEQATLMVQESELTEQEKRRRILEGLRGPALEIVKSLRLSKPRATAQEFLDAMDCAFGSAESAEDLYFSFRLIQQKSGEKLSDYVRRIEPFLAKVVKKGGVSANEKDKVRVEQLLRGAIDSDLMLLQLRLKERRSTPPNFLDLLSEIRTEEEYQQTRKKTQRLSSFPLDGDKSQSEQRTQEENQAMVGFHKTKTAASHSYKKRHSLPQLLHGISHHQNLYKRIKGALDALHKRMHIKRAVCFPFRADRLCIMHSLAAALLERLKD
uniref:Uncharacterized protein n=1 Tax=Kryptolebias marmoratus TaxID=37003 RepID=A0A3Q3GGF0_KRYMA